MGQACGCTESTVTAKEEITHNNEPKSKYSAPSVQNKSTQNQNIQNHQDGGESSTDYKSKTQQ